MSAISLDTAQARLTAYLDAEAAVLAGQTVEFQGRKLTLANLAEIQRGIDIWTQRVNLATQAAAGKTRCVTVSPRF
jgi:hypothetical protein